MSNRQRNIFLSVTVLALVTLACNALLPLPTETSEPTQIIEPVSTRPQGNVPLTEAEVPRVDVNVAKAALDSGEAIIVDVRSQSAYDASHVAGSLFIPLGSFETDIENIDLPKDQWIITYCTWPNEHTSARAAFLLLQNGYTQASAIRGGLQAWIDAGYPIEP